MFNSTEIPKQFKVFSIQPELRIRFSNQTWQRILFFVFFLTFLAIFVGHCLMISVSLYEILHFNFEKANQFFSYGTNNLWYVLIFVFTFFILSISTWSCLWVTFGFYEIIAAKESLTTIYKMLGMSHCKSVLIKEIQYFNQFRKKDSEGNTWDLEIVTNQKLFDEDKSFPSWFPQKWVSADMLVRINYKTIHLYGHSSPKPSQWLGKALARFYRVEFKSATQSDLTAL